MCGIVGVVAIEGPLNPAYADAIPAMTEALTHRGPDEGGVFRGAWGVLGHRRLSIIDRACGAQPIPNEDESRWIVFNGEIYNHHGLHRELIARGHRFRTSSDTETILHGYEEWGPAVVDRLEGMFAFAIHDAGSGETFIARDRLGKKPLFYATLGGALHFASEIKALYPSPAWDGTLDLTSLEDYLSLGYILAPKTIYRHVHKLRPGHWLRVSREFLHIQQYWDVPEFDTLPESADAAGELEATLREAVGSRLESEVPLGAFLSGGIDSGLVVSFMADAKPSSLVTTSVGFASAAHNELAAAAVTARRFGTEHHEAVIDPRLEDVLDRIVGAFDEPFADASAIPTYYVSQMARRHVTVAMSGDGGDETYGGYSFRYVPHALEEYARHFGPLLRTAAGAAGRRWPRGSDLPRALRLGTLLENVERDPAAAYFFDLCFTKPATARALMGGPALRDVRDAHAYDAVTEPYRRCPSPNVLQRAMYADLMVYLPNDVLVKVDRMSMQHGLEVRCPILDRRVVELAFRTPAERKMPRLQPKHLLRTIARRRLPDELLRLPKRGFSAPVAEWLRGPYAAAFRDDVLSQQSLVSTLLDLREVRRLFDAHQARHADHGQTLWTIWMLERWGKIARAAETAEGMVAGFSSPL